MGAQGDAAAFAARPRNSSFEIRKGKRNSADESGIDDSIPISAIALPQSMTSEEEGAELRSRLGVEHIPDLDRRHGSVRVTQSRGAEGPDRKRTGLKVFLLLLVVVGVGVGVAWKMGYLVGLIPQ